MVAAGLVLAAGGVQARAAAADRKLPARTASSAGAPARFHDQSITWRGCQLDAADEVGKALDAAGAQCAQVTVPVDYGRPDGPTTTVAVTRRKATDRAHRLGTLVVNTGGPNESLSGVTWMAQGMPPIVVGSPQMAARSVTFFEDNPCIDGLANRYLLTGLLPGDRADCTRTSPCPDTSAPGTRGPKGR
ncbi:hypothetical protein GCM10009678_52140 [Actinomadura kijaniata]|uniref:Alpha/beta hydrolase n=1 Tax=Actinomadura namibiensis TaxID=182080 RepID=A0A7W3LQD7_ACTNM|nr:hypothetical protein [Actinomadura namibiensis]MBA8952355.1 hypothetical protein [Actinomadura namibiensis]